MMIWVVWWHGYLVIYFIMDDCRDVLFTRWDIIIIIIIIIIIMLWYMLKKKKNYLRNFGDLLKM